MPVIASGSEAIQSGLRNPGLLRRFAPRNDEGYLTRAELFHQRPRLGQILVEYHDAHPDHQPDPVRDVHISEETTSELKSLMPISYAVFCWKQTTTSQTHIQNTTTLQIDN